MKKTYKFINHSTQAAQFYQEEARGTKRTRGWRMCTGLGGAIDELGRDQEKRVINKDDYEWNELMTSFSDDWSDDSRLG